MEKCVFFGHRDANYAPYREKIRFEMIELIEKAGVTQFYSGGRGNFDNVCAREVYELKRKYPKIKNILFLSYHPDKRFELPGIYDESVFLLDREVPPLYAIVETNKAVADIADVVMAGILNDFGGAFEAVVYAKRKGKMIVDVCNCGYFK